jgi:TRAP-type C4-dicarboxylate transport system permease small subunit
MLVINSFIIKIIVEILVAVLLAVFSWLLFDKVIKQNSPKDKLKVFFFIYLPIIVLAVIVACFVQEFVSYVFIEVFKNYNEGGGFIRYK